LFFNILLALLEEDIFLIMSFQSIFLSRSSSHSDISPNSLYADLRLRRSTSIRLLKLLHPGDGGQIRCRLDVVDLKSKPDYRAVSYTWGPPTPEAKQQGMTANKSCAVLCNEKELLVTENLFHFLRHASQELEEYGGYFWVDAICINQDDKTEKSSEVLKMADTYRSASGVLVWLGESDEISQQAIQLIIVLAALPADVRRAMNPENMQNADAVASSLGDSITPGHWKSLELFFNRTWFTRVWIIQEVILAEKVNLLCGTDTMKWQNLVVVSDYVAFSSWRAYFSTYESRTFYPASPAILERMKWQMETGLDWSLDIILSKARGYLASEENDCVYALLSLSKDRFVKPWFRTPLLCPDYHRGPHETYALVARLILEHSKNLLLLSMVEDDSIRKATGIPSWAPGWSVDFHGIGIQAAVFFSAAATMTQKPRVSRSTDPSLLLVRGAFLDTVAETGSMKDEMFIDWASFKRVFQMLESLDPTYITGQHRMEALWRTLILDIDVENAIHPVSHSMEASFQSWIQFTATALIYRMKEEDRKEALAYLEKLTKESKALPTPIDTNGYLATLDKDPNTRFDSLIAAMLPYRMSYGYFGRLKIFRTAKNFLGVGQCSILAGDEIWILPGTTVPITLRKKSANRRYRVVGDMYVHGFMHGEALTGHGLDFVGIEIE
jgi:hypothetical protein